MNHAFEGCVLRIELPQEITANTIEEFSEDLFGIAVADSVREIVLDAKQLGYISSAGLRVLLRYTKSHSSISMRITNASSYVYDVLDMTGYVQIFKVEKALRFVDVDGLEELGRGMYGSVYRVDDETILKVFYDVNSREQLERILGNVRTAFVAGIPTIIPFDTVQTKAGLGVVFELLDSECLADIAHGHPESIDGCARHMAQLARKMANTEFAEGSMGSRKAMLRSELESASSFLGQEEYQELLGYLDAVPERNTGVHGDFHARNIYLVDGKPLLIDMDDFSLGHPVWDIACLYRVYPYLIGLSPSEAQDLFGLDDSIPYEDFYYRIMHVSFEEGTQLWETFISYYFEGRTDDEIAAFLQTSRFYSDYMVIRFVLDQCRKVADQPEVLAEKAGFIRDVLARMRESDCDQLIENLKAW